MQRHPEVRADLGREVRWALPLKTDDFPHPARLWPGWLCRQADRRWISAPAAATSKPDSKIRAAKARNWTV